MLTGGIALGINELAAFPKYIEFQTQSFCNGQCAPCPYSSTEKCFTPARMSDEGIDRILTELVAHSHEVVRAIPYMNNEPTLDRRFLSVLRRLKESGIFVEVSSNTSGLNEELMEAILLERLIDDFRISFFGGTEQLYKELMPGLNFHKTVDRIKQLLERNKAIGHPVDIQLVAILCPWVDMEENVRSIEELFPEAKLHLFGFLDRAGSVEGHGNAKKLVPTTGMEQNPLAGCQLLRPFERMNILANGDAIICSQDWRREVVLGNVLESSIEDVWHSERANEIRKYVLGETGGLPSDFICTRCKAALLKPEFGGGSNFTGDRYLDESGRKAIVPGQKAGI